MSHILGLIAFCLKLLPLSCFIGERVGDSLVGQTVNNLSAMWETWVSLGWEDLLEKEIAIHSTILAWDTPWTEEPGRLSPWGRRESDTTEHTHVHVEDRREGQLSVLVLVV